MGHDLFDVVKLVMPGVIFGLLIAGAIVRLNGDNLRIKLSNAEPLADVVGAAIAVLVQSSPASPMSGAPRRSSRWWPCDRYRI
jgi:hypothetical protein